MTVVPFKNNYRVPFPIQDIDRGSFRYLHPFPDISNITVMLGISCEIPNSFSNIFYSVNLTLDFESMKIKMD